MNDEDFIELRDLVKTELVRAGLSNIADDSNYIIERRSDEDGSRRLPQPDKHLLLLLQAFRRYLVANDVRLLNLSLQAIKLATGGEGPSRVEVEPELREDSVSGEVVDEGVRFDLSMARNHSDLIGQVDDLIEGLFGEGRRRE